MKDNTLKDKKIVFLGDSITESYGASSVDKGYVNQVGVRTGANAINLGIGGTRFAYKKTPTIGNLIYDLFFETRIYEIPLDADIIVVFGGTNDYGHGDAPLGKMGDDTIFSFYGAVSVLIKKLKYGFPNSLLIFATPTKRKLEHERGLNLIDFVNAIKEVCDKYNVPIIDLYNLFDVDMQNDSERGKYMFDFTHPNDLGYSYIADLFIKNIEDIINNNTVEAKDGNN